MTQMVASGGEVDIVNLIGNHECSKTPPSLYNEDGIMRAAGTNASPVKVLREETGVSVVPNLPQHNLKTAVVPQRNEIHDLMNIHEQFMNIHEQFVNISHIWFMN